MGRYVIILVAGFALIFGLMKMRLNRQGLQANELACERYEDLVSMNLANSAAQLCLLQLRTNPDWRTGYVNVALAGGKISGSVFDSSDDPSLGPDTVRIRTTGICGQDSTTVQLRAALNVYDWPVKVDAGITARADVSVGGDVVVDGRDHNLNGDLIPNNGVKAVFTTKSFSRSGTSKIGGTTDAGVDFAPAADGWGSVVDQNAVLVGGYPTSPDQVMGGASVGFPEGTLKSIAQSGVYGSQYVTNPLLLNYPLRGITYVELPNGSAWWPATFGSNASKGIFVVHNSAGNAKIKNISSGKFRGLVISDDMVNLQTKVIGAIVLLSPTPSEGSFIGVGWGSLLFSRAALETCIEEAGLEFTDISVFEYWE